MYPFIIFSAILCFRFINVKSIDLAYVFHLLVVFDDRH